MWDNLALNQPAWASSVVADHPASQAVDNNVTTSGHTGSVGFPFLAVDLGNNVLIGKVTVRFAGSELQGIVLRGANELMNVQEPLLQYKDHFTYIGIFII